MGGSQMLGKKLPFFSAPPMDFSQMLAPPRTTLIFGSTAFMASTMLLYFTQYWFSDMRPACQGPYISLPIVQQRTLKGSVLPFSARILPMRVFTEPLQYSTSSAASRADPYPLLIVRSGSAPTNRLRAMKSCRPTSFDSLPRGGRLSRSPRPSRQSYAETKLPPGHLNILKPSSL